MDPPHDRILLATACRLGLTRAASSDSEIRRLRPRRVRRGVYCLHPNLRPGFIESVVAALLVLPPGTVAAGVTAARLWGFDVPIDTGAPLEFLVPGKRNRVKLTDAVLRFGQVDDIERPQGVPSTNRARTMIDLVGRLRFDDAVTLVEAGLRRDPGLTVQMKHEQDRRPNRRGRALIASVLDFADSLSESPLESRARILWHEARLPAPTQQAVIRSNGSFVARVDFLWDEARLIVEVDGLAKYDEPGALAAEKRRQNELVSLGYTVLRFTWADVVGNPEYVVAQVRAALAM